jgi:hypothetical protein
LQKKRDLGYAKVLNKMDTKMSEILKTMGIRCPPKKKKEKKEKVKE